MGAGAPPGERGVVPIARRRQLACAATVLACLPYLALKAAWLAGSSVGEAPGAASAGMHDQRYVVGNMVTLGMDLVAVALVLALTFPWGRRVPGVLLAAPVWVATGLLAPVALGLPVGLLVQALAGGAPAAGDNGLDGWVYAVAYGGFVVQALGILAAFWWHARERWPERLAALPVAGGPGLAAAAAMAAGFGLLHLVWAVAGSAAGGPGGFETAAQRTYLAVTGLLVLAGAVAVAASGRLGAGRLGPALPALAWVGTAVTVLAGPTKMLLAHDGHAGTTVVVAGTLGTLAGLVLTARAWSPRARSYPVDPGPSTVRGPR
jgi:hypothetical protein